MVNQLFQTVKVVGQNHRNDFISNNTKANITQFILHIELLNPSNTKANPNYTILISLNINKYLKPNKHEQLHHRQEKC